MADAPFGIVLWKLNPTSMKTILVPIDLSPQSHHIAHFGLELAAYPEEARLLLLHVAQPVTPAAVPEAAVVDPGAWQDQYLDELAIQMRRFEEGLKEYQSERGSCPQVQVATRMVVGRPATSILEIIRTEQPVFVVMGTVGASNAWDQMVGSVASYVAQRSNVPLWIIPNAVKLDSIRRFAYFADLQDDEVSCIEQVINLGDHLRARPDVVHISPLSEPAFEAADMIIRAFEENHSPAEVSFRHLVYEDVSDGIESYVLNHWPDAIVLAHRNRDFIERIFHSSVIRHLALSTKRPLLIIPKSESPDYRS